jgi:SAM-dependent methyltransferase
MSANTAVQTAADPGLGDALAAEAYLRGRQEPHRSDGDYLILSDVRRVIANHAPDMYGDVFDYGCGGAPYASYFAHCRSYVKADMVRGPMVDRLLEPNGMTREADGSYDWVISTQVLEHVPDPMAYLRECERLLKPRGNLLLTTHGLYPEHRCPFDFHRWTGDGLLAAIRALGMEIRAEGKLTANVRGAVQLLHHCVWSLRPEADRRVWNLVLGGVRKVHGWVGVPLLNRIADCFPAQSIVPIASDTRLYVGVYVRARKPSA